MGAFGDGYRCLRPAANRLETAGRSVSPLAAAGYLSSTSRFTPPPPPAHGPAERSYYLQAFLSTIMGGRWLRGAKAYKGGRDSNFERVNNWPGHSAAPGPPKNHG